MGRRQTNAAGGLSDLPAAPPRFIEPMKARLETELPRSADWLFEVKLDGIRAIAVKDGSRVQLWSRRPRDITAEYPAIVRAIGELPVQNAVLDGEIAALDSKGRTSFQAWQNSRSNAADPAELVYYAFDLLQVEGRAVTALPLTQRRASLEILIRTERGPLRLSPLIEGTPTHVWKVVEQQGFEGVIAKQRHSPYEPGRRSGAWLKIKRQNEQEFVIGGYTAPEGSRTHFGSLLLGVYEGAKLMFVSRVGTGFNFGQLKTLHQLFQPHRTEVCPFANLPTRRAGRFGQGVTAADMRRCAWLKPKLVCQVRFLEWTGDFSLRQPVFLGLRDDKKPEDVVRERAA